MSINGRTVLATQDLTTHEIESVFELTEKLITDRHLQAPKYSMITAFFEPSTRTKMSFQMAGARVGVQAVNFDSGFSSLSKGESYSDTVLNLISMQPDLFIIRYNESVELDQLLPTLKIPVISGGTGKTAHPTQALLDVFTIKRERKNLAGEKVFIVGDIEHSRVARSNYDVLTRMGCEVGFAGPKAMLPNRSEFPQAHFFDRLDDGIKWATVLMGLRIQLERHATGQKLSERDYHAEFGISSERLKNFAKDGIIMHPGPINQGIEFAPEVLRDHRCRVLQQVTNGVAVRAALMKKVLGA